MRIWSRRESNAPAGYGFLLLLATAVLVPCVASAQGLTGALKGTVVDQQGGRIPGAIVRIHSARIGGPPPQTTDEKGQFFFLTLSPGSYVLSVEREKFATYMEDVQIVEGATIEREPAMSIADVPKEVKVVPRGSRIEEHDPGLAFVLQDFRNIPLRGSGSVDIYRLFPVAPTSPTSGLVSTLSVFGSGTNESKFIRDGLNFTCPCNGVARADPGLAFIRAIRFQPVGAPAEVGGFQGGLFSVTTKEGGEQYQYDAAFYGQPASLTSRPVFLPLTSPLTGQSGYERDKYRDFTTTMGGPVKPRWLYFFGGYQHVRDYDSQPGADPAFPRTYKQDKIFEKFTLKLTPRLQIDQSFHDEFVVSPDRPTQVTLAEAISRPHGSVPSTTFHLQYSESDNTIWDIRVGRFAFKRTDELSNGDPAASNHFDRVTGVSRGAPPRVGKLTIERTTAKTTLTHLQKGFLGGDHLVISGAEIERGGHRSLAVIPNGVRYNDNNEAPSEAVSTPASLAGGMSDTVAAFLSDTVTMGPLTISGGIRFDHNRAFHQDLPAVDAQGNETGDIVRGQGTLYAWNLWSPRLGVIAKLTPRVRARLSFGRFYQGVLTGELEPFHPGSTPTTTRAYDPATGDYTGTVRVVDPKLNLQLDPGIRAPRTDVLSAGIDYEFARLLNMTFALVHKEGRDFIGWIDVGGQYREETRTLPDGRIVPVFVLTNGTPARKFQLTNPEGYSLNYNGLVLVVEKRPFHGWQALGSYTFSHTVGLQVSSGAAAAAPQASTVSPPQPLSFGRDPNDLTNARGRLPNDRPHMFRLMGSVEIPRSSLEVAANFQYLSGKPWAATAQISLAQGNQRILLETPGTRRLPSQTPLDLRISRKFSLGKAGVEALVDVFNVLNDKAEEGLATDNLFSSNFGRPTIFMDPRRAMIGLRFSLNDER